jgi:exo-beta-1,3-glucanase (GH17 family)
MDETRKINPEKEVILTEFGWPNGPKGVTEVNTHTGQHCGIASKQNQAEVIKSTFQKLAQRNWTGVAFEAFSENWKPGNEGNVGGYWGICQGTPPYSCLTGLKGN